MCGIIGYLGPQDAVEVIFQGLQRLEYRGYDSAGIAVIRDGEFEVRRSEGKLNRLGKILEQHPISGPVGIGHTRWATHGRPSETNAHPHLSGSIALVHNGIIENYLELKARLLKEGHTFASETDSEIVAHLIDHYARDLDLVEAVRKALEEIKGSYALVVLQQGQPQRMVAVRKECPLVIGLGEGELYVASDILAFLHHTDQVIYLEDGEVAVLELPRPEIRNQQRERLTKKIQKIPWNPVMAEKAGYKHFMQKEIFEQPQCLIDTFRGRISPETGEVALSEFGLSDRELQEVRRIIVVACGTSWHAGLVAKFLLEEYLRIPVDVDYGSEYRYRNPIIDDRTLIILISQSGETADTLAALREGRRQGARILAICNVVGSTLAREADGVIYTHAGPEIGVASTKAFTTQLVALNLLTLYLGQELGCVSSAERIRVAQDLLRLPGGVETLLEGEKQIAAVAHTYFQAQDFLFLGRGIHYPIALEGALKLKEISYIHAEGYPAGEMKHGPIALIDEHLPTVMLLPDNAVMEKVQSNLQEVRARGGRIIALTDREAGAAEKIEADALIPVPKISWSLSPILFTIPLQLLAYHIAVLRGTDVDQPRNLAKSVTVE
ncbi:MAG: glutamine--fructose-6-phosphate transaminase (isomerizing) [Deltaproteobacteria bacterium]|nr:glutamine--fructose-6-phosphate transaminase (isomerizing) [Deltaproteobacteria bacterium]